MTLPDQTEIPARPFDVGVDQSDVSPGESLRRTPPGSSAATKVAIGAIAFGAFAIGALAIGALAIGRLAVGTARIRTLRIDHLVIRRISETD
jgi:hypothetical protein